MAKALWFLIGSVGVDSGQLMVCDPCYIDGHWKQNTESQGHPWLKLTEKGTAKWPQYDNRRWKCDPFNSHAGEAVADFKYIFRNYETIIPELGMSMNAARKEGLVEEIPNEVLHDFSYEGACSTTSGDDGFGMLSKEQRPPQSDPESWGSMAAVFQSGMGDGVYEVWGRKNSDGRIVEVRIKMG